MKPFVSVTAYKVSYIFAKTETLPYKNVYYESLKHQNITVCSMMMQYGNTATSYSNSQQTYKPPALLA